MRQQEIKEGLTGLGLNHNYIFRVAPLWLVETIVKRCYENPWEALPENPRLLFIHVPKCAGTSISHALYEKVTGHQSAALYMAWDPQRFRATPSLAVVRNPYDRFCSIFHQYRKSPWGGRAEESFRRFCLTLDSPADLAYVLAKDKRIRSRFMSLVHARPQVDWIMVEGKVAVNHLFLFEDLAKLEVVLRERLNGHAISLPIANSSRREKAWGTELDQHAKTIVEDLYTEDVKLWESMC